MKQNNVIGKAEVGNIIEYVWDTGLRGVKHKQHLETVYLAWKLQDNSTARCKKLNVSLLSLMH